MVRAYIPVALGSGGRVDREITKFDYWAYLGDTADSNIPDHNTKVNISIK